MSRVIVKNKIFLTGSHVFLRALTVDDMTDEYIDGLNDPEVNCYLLFARPQTKATVGEYIRRNEEDRGALLLGVFLKNDPNPFVGTVRISDISWQHWLANVGVCLFARRAWKKGYALEAMGLAVNYCFQELGLHYLEAGAYAENVNSVSLFQRAGFNEVYRIKNKYVHEGRFKEAVYLGIENKAFNEAVLTRN